MGRRVITTFVCDLCGADLGPDRMQVDFGVGGATYRLDLCPRDGREISDSLARWRSAGTEIGRKRTGGESQPPGPASAGPTPERSPFEVAAIRRWAREQGIEVSQRGRIGRSVVEQYDASRQEQASAE